MGEAYVDFLEGHDPEETRKRMGQLGTETSADQVAALVCHFSRVVLNRAVGFSPRNGEEYRGGGAGGGFINRFDQREAS